jgi:hypothetical protein
VQAAIPCPNPLLHSITHHYLQRNKKFKSIGRSCYQGMFLAECQWLKPVILATWEAKIIV